MTGPIEPCPGCNEELKMGSPEDIRRSFVILCKRYELLGEQLKNLSMSLSQFLETLHADEGHQS